MDFKKPLRASTAVIVILLALLAGAALGFGGNGFTLRGFSTFFIGSLIAWIIFGLLARAISK